MNDLTALNSQYEAIQAQGLNLDLTRGKPASEQLDLSDAIDGVLNGDYRCEDGTDARNYGNLRGIPEARQLGSRLLDIPAEQVIAGGGSSLLLMYQIVDALQNFGLACKPLKAKGKLKAICPVPGYDRHYTLTDRLGFDMVTVPITDTGPDMDEVERIVREDSATSFIWCVPNHSNPTGCIYDANTVRRLAALPSLRSPTETPMFVLWDNAYAVHDFEEDCPKLDPIWPHAQESNTTDRLIMFSSTSKMTHAGAGIAFCAGSDAVLADIEHYLSAMLVGPDKVNQLRHARFLDNGARVEEHMRKHAEILRPKFRAVIDGLTQDLGNLGIASWTEPKGGYFVSLDVTPGLASKVVALAADAGLALTPAGATFPYGDDPRDENIRIAPSFAAQSDVENAVQTLTLCVKLAAAKSD